MAAGSRRTVPAMRIDGIFPERTRTYTVFLPIPSRSASLVTESAERMALMRATMVSGFEGTPRSMVIRTVGAWPKVRQFC